MPQGEMDLSGIIERLMKSEDAAQMIEKLKASVENAPKEAANAPEKDAAAEDDTSVSQLPSTDQLSEKLPQIMTALAPLMDNGVIGSGKLCRTSSERNNLLSAMRPFMSEGRRSMIDSFMTLSKLSGLMELLPKKK
ncbi:MAG: hypothetical protein IJ457_09910 [Clostridia bacterium]|nr:hypothetical protein [Clostridia bacterium]